MTYSIMKPISRVEILIKHEGLSISAFEKKVGMSNNSIQTAIKRNANLKDDTLNSILKVFNRVNPEWLLTGNGEMFRGINYEEKTTSNFTPNNTSNSEKTVYVREDSLNDAKKMAPKMAPNTASKSNKTVYSGEESLNDHDDNKGSHYDKEVQLLKQLLEERERLVFSLNETINSKNEAIKAQKTYIESLEQRLAQLEGDIKANREQIN